MTDALVIETSELRKRYGDAEAVSGLNLRVRDSIFGCLGRSGAGKTTTIKLLLGMTQPTSGEVRSSACRPMRYAAAVNLRRRDF